jgi:hypothetical protein
LVRRTCDRTRARIGWKTPLVVTTLTPVFARLFDRDALLLEARRLGAVKRDRMLYVWDVLLAMVRCAIGDEHRSVATARRQFFDLTGLMPEESSFYERLTPAFADRAVASRTLRRWRLLRFGRWTPKRARSSRR